MDAQTSIAVRFFARRFWALTRAATLRHILRWADLVEVPYCSAPARFAAEPNRPSFWALHRRYAYNATPTLNSSIVRNQVVLALRQLAHAGLALRAAAATAGAYPAAASAIPALAKPSLLTGQPVTYRVEPNGGAVLDLPKAAEQVRDIYPSKVSAPLLTVTLPPPGR